VEPKASDVQTASGQSEGGGTAVGIQVTVDYLPAAKPLHREFDPETTLEVVRAAAMDFFGVRDRQERDTYKYYLSFENSRMTDTSQTLEHLLGPHRKGAHFHLVEEITPGTTS
jgi:hypothetical protein